MGMLNGKDLNEKKKMEMANWKERKGLEEETIPQEEDK